jgi:hypothetical protein
MAGRTGDGNSVGALPVKRKLTTTTSGAVGSRIHFTAGKIARATESHSSACQENEEKGSERFMLVCLSKMVLTPFLSLKCSCYQGRRELEFQQLVDDVAVLLCRLRA